MRHRTLASMALAASVAFFAAPALGAPAKVQNKQKVRQKNHSTGHLQHLLTAEMQLVDAEAALAARNAGKARQHVGSALKQVREAAGHHHKHHIATAGKSSGFSGTYQKGRHHKHHSLLRQAESELIAAEKALSAGKGAQASKDITRAARTIKNAVSSHHHLYGKL